MRAVRPRDLKFGTKVTNMQKWTHERFDCTSSTVSIESALRKTRNVRFHMGNERTQNHFTEMGNNESWAGGIIQDGRWKRRAVIIRLICLN